MKFTVRETIELHRQLTQQWLGFDACVDGRMRFGSFEIARYVTPSGACSEFIFDFGTKQCITLRRWRKSQRVYIDPNRGFIDDYLYGWFPNFPDANQTMKIKLHL